MVQYHKSNMHAHLFTARVAGHLLDLGYESEKVILEPDMGGKDGPHPDIKIEDPMGKCYVECKTNVISNFYGLRMKQALADFIYKTIKTCDQLDIFSEGPIDLNETKALIANEQNIQRVYRCYEHGKDRKETDIALSETLTLGVFQQPAIVGGEDDFLEVKMGGYLEKTDTRKRYIGFSFMKGGRAIGVWSLEDYSLKWKAKREQSERQMVPGAVNIVFVDGYDVVGDPILNPEYIKNVWLDEEIPECSGVAILNPTVSRAMDYYPNRHASHPYSFRSATEE